MDIGWVIAVERPRTLIAGATRARASPGILVYRARFMGSPRGGEDGRELGCRRQEICAGRQ